MASSIESSVLKVAASLIPALGRTVVAKARMVQIEEQASNVMVADNVERFLADLRPVQIERMHELVYSPEFSSLMVQSMVASIKGLSEDSVGQIREQVSTCLARWSIFEQVDLVQATDVMTELLTFSSNAVRSAAGATLTTPHAVAMAARHAIVAARNSATVIEIAGRKEVEDQARQLRSQTRVKHSKLRLPSVVIDKRVPWSQLYVPARLRPSSRDVRAFPKDELTILDLLSGPHGVVVLGNPGAGKSTLASKLAFDIASSRSENDETRLAIVLPIQKYADRISRHEDDLVAYVVATCSASYGVTIERRSMEYLLITGRVVVVVDGVDELGEASKRNDLVELVEAFASAYPRTRVVVTSREIGYREASLDADLFPAVIVQPFSSSDVERYVRFWFKIVDRRELADSFIVESARVNDLRESPLVLSLLCTLYQAEQSLPANRPDIYARCSSLLVETWDRSRGVNLHDDLYPFMGRVIQGLAYRLLIDDRQRQALPQRELQQFLSTQILADRYSTPEEAERASVNFLKFCANRAWVLTDTGAGEIEPWYGFTHKTFLEYFAACHLVKGESTVGDVWNRLKPIIAKQDGSVVADLAIQVLDRDRTDGASVLLDQALLESTQMSDEELGRFLLFAAQALESTAPSTNVLVRIAERVADAATVDRDIFAMPAWSYLQRERALSVLLSLRLPANKTRVANAIFAQWREVLRAVS